PLSKSPRRTRRTGAWDAWTQADPSAISFAPAQRGGLRGRSFHGRCRHADDLGGALSRHERTAASAGILGAWLDGQCHGACDRRPGVAAGATGGVDVRRWRIRHADGRPDYAATDEAAG